MATYELQGGEIYASLSLGGGQIFASPSLGGGEIYAGGGGGGGGNLQPSKSVSYTPTESAQSATVTPDYGYDGMEEVSVSVGAIPSDYVGSDIPLCDSSDVDTTITDNNFIRSHSVDVADGYYENSVSLLNPFGEAVFDGMHTPHIDPSTGDLTITFSADTAGMAYTKGTYTLTQDGAFNVKGAQTYTPGTTDQTISSGYLLTGNQTILGDADLVASNIKKDVEIFGVTGTYEGGGGGASFNFTGASDKLFGGLAKALADGNYVSGNVTFTTAFPNTWGTLIDTGLETLEGFCAWMQNSTSVQSSQGCNDFVIFKVNSTDTLDFMGVGRPINANTNVLGTRRTTYSQETAIEGAGLQGALRINGGIIEFKGRYNRNANYQIFPTNQVIEWIAW